MLLQSALHLLDLVLYCFELLLHVFELLLHVFELLSNDRAHDGRQVRTSDRVCAQLVWLAFRLVLSIAWHRDFKPQTCAIDWSDLACGLVKRHLI